MVNLKLYKAWLLCPQIEMFSWPKPNSCFTHINWSLFILVNPKSKASYLKVLILFLHSSSNQIKNKDFKCLVICSCIFIYLYGMLVCYEYCIWVIAISQVKLGMLGRENFIIWFAKIGKSEIVPIGEVCNI